MTPRQKQVRDFVAAAIERTGCAPSFAEIQAGLGLHSKSGVHRIVTKLVDLGELVRIAGAPTRNLALPGVDLTSVETAALVAELERRGWSRG